MEFKQFYIWSKKWTKGDLKTFWRPNCKGYTFNLNEAGIYNEQFASEMKDIYPIIRSELQYRKANLSKKKDTFLIPVEKIDVIGRKITAITN